MVSVGITVLAESLQQAEESTATAVESEPASVSVSVPQLNAKRAQKMADAKRSFFIF